MTNEKKLKLIGEITNHPLKEDFQAWAKLNPHVIDEIIANARKVKASGRDTYSIKVLAERARWELTIERGLEDFSLNNSHIPLLGRLVMLLAPDLDGMFEFRKMKEKKNASPEQALSA